MNPGEGIRALIAFPLYPNKSVHDIIFKGGRWSVLNATIKSKIIFGVAAGMASVHARGIIHRDLKPGHILLDDDFEPVICDFALAHHYGIEQEGTGVMGSPAFMAPEIFKEMPYGFGVDVYAFGCTLYTLFAEPGTFDNGKVCRTMGTLSQAVMRGARYVRTPEIPDYHWDVITRCWVDDPDGRPQFRTLVEEFHRDRAYVLEGAERDEVLEYEERVYEVFGEPKTDF
jgi:serine/threonine protein kinase